ncbi:MAG TPA: NAD(P)/FAD-dependent oxidoreductase [Chitinophagaceae bacterium]|nr:NAD(P)/FAD-dependent oxidoreductase [Chitinophagaceae bacterium]
MSNSKKRLVVIGGGAAGFFCAVNAARLNPSLEVILIEKTGKLLSKVKVSGGGRCNVTHACFDIPEMVSKYPRGTNFLKKTFHQFFTKDTIAWFQQRGVQLKTEEDGRMFPVTDSSQTIIECLLREANLHHVQIRMNREVRALNRAGHKWEIALSGEEQLQADAVCIACGGYSRITQFRWLLDLGHTVEEPIPSLFTFNLPQHPIRQLMGVSTEARVKIVGSKLTETGPVLITHWGLSGPAVLRLSAWGARELAAKKYDFSIIVNWLPEYHEQNLRARLQEIRTTAAQRKVQVFHQFDLPQRLWQFLCEQSGISADMRWADLPAVSQNKLVNNLAAYTATVKGKTTFKEEFVTAGGIRLSEVDANSMQSKKHTGLYFAGEILDVDGITGGFNFQHAWTSGFIAANHIALHH